MGWLPFGSSGEEGVKKTSGGAFESPSRSNRKKCYEARDAFFECLDQNNILDSVHTKDGIAKSNKACGPQNQVFEANCAHSWVGQSKRKISIAGKNSDADALCVGGILQEAESRQLSEGADHQEDRSRRWGDSRPSTTYKGFMMHIEHFHTLLTNVQQCILCKDAAGRSGRGVATD